MRSVAALRLSNCVLSRSVPKWAGCGCAQGREVIANALGVDAEIAAPIARGRAQVDAAARVRWSDPNDDIVGKAHPAASLARLDPACRLVRRDDRPTHSLRHIKRSRECYIGCQSDGQRDNVRIGPPLLFGNPGAFIGNRIDAFVLPQRGNRDKGWRIVRIGGDVVDWWHRLTDLVVMPRHVGNQGTPDKRHDGERDAPPIEPREPNDKCYYRDDRGGKTEIRRPRHQGQQRETEMPPPRAPVVLRQSQLTLMPVPGHGAVEIVERWTSSSQWS